MLTVNSISRRISNNKRKTSLSFDKEGYEPLSIIAYIPIDSIHKNIVDKNYLDSYEAKIISTWPHQLFEFNESTEEYDWFYQY